MVARIIVALAFGLWIGVIGCSRPPASKVVDNARGPKGGGREDSIKTSLDALSRATTFAEYREGLHLLNNHLRKSENQDFFLLSKEDRHALTTGFGLEKEDLEAVEARAFQPLDAHHLETCYLLRDAARTLAQPDLDPLEQARLGLAWVDRQVLLREGAGDLLPPFYALQAGLGNTRERALVFLALLQQFRLPACVLLWPESEPDKSGPILVGVLIKKGERADVYLFDPRLGRPVPGPDGIATLAQLRKDPKLFVFSGPKGDSRPEAFLACSLCALSPRMRFLEKKLGRGDPIVLAIEPALLMQQVKEAAGAVKAWTPSLLALAAFLPESEGGTDKTGRLNKYEAQRIPILAVAQNYAAMRLLGEDMPVKQAQLILLNFAQQLFTKYAREPHALLLRGQTDKAIKKLQIMRAAFEDLEFSPLPDFTKRVNLWRDEVIQRFLALIRAKQAGLEDGAKAAADALWNRDQYLVVLLNGQDVPDPQKHPKAELSHIVLTAVKNALEEQILYLLAGAWQEKAERAQATWERLKRKAGKAEAVRPAAAARDAWTNAQGWWKKYVEGHPLAWSALEPRFRAIQLRWQRGEKEQVLSLWDLFLSELHRAAAARMFQARANENLGQTKEAISNLMKLEDDLTALLENSEIKKELAAALERVRGQGNAVQGAVLEGLTRDLGPDGGLFWLREKARGRLQRLKNEK